MCRWIVSQLFVSGRKSDLRSVGKAPPLFTDMCVTRGLESLHWRALEKLLHVLPAVAHSLLSTCQHQVFETDALLCNQSCVSFWLFKSETVCVNCPQYGMTPLMHAAYKGKADMCRLLLQHGADVNCNQHEHGYTALMFAGLSGKMLL